MAEPAWVHIVDDDDIVRRSLAHMAASAGFATRSYASAEQFVATATPAGADCVITDVRMPGMSGLQLALQLEASGLALPVIVMSGEADIDMAVEAMKAGAADFLQKPFRTADLAAAIKGALERAERQMRQAQEAGRCREALALLSPRQRDVLDGVLAGKLSKTIAHELGISVRTVEGYRVEIMAKTQAQGLSGLVRMAVLAGL
jgi:two-component system response regulator FixJ